MNNSVIIPKVVDAVMQMGDFGKDDPLGAYVEFVMAVPVPKPRKIVKSREFSCPKENQKGLEKLEEAISRGDDLMLWMSKQYRPDKFYCKDHLMHLYSVSHFHLGEEMDANQRISRTSNLLYAYVDRDVVCELDVRGHGEWGNMEWQEMLLSNWPDKFRGNVLPADVLDVAYNPSDEAVLELAKIGINTFLKTPSGVSMPIGGGVTAAKTSPDATYFANRIRKEIQRREKDYIELIELGYENLKLSEVSIVGDKIAIRFPNWGDWIFPIPRCK